MNRSAQYSAMSANEGCRYGSPPEIFTANVSYLDFDAGETLEPKPGVKLRTARLNHPDRATGYRVDFAGKSLCYLTDTQHVVGKPDKNVLDLIHGADMVIYDSTYTDAEFPKRADWGHSTWEEGVRLCERLGVDGLIIDADLTPTATPGMYSDYHLVAPRAPSIGAAPILPHA